MSQLERFATPPSWQPLDHSFLVPDNLSQPRTITDPVHGQFKLPKYALDIIDTPQFQRLRDIKQLGFLDFNPLGTTSLVFPGATHTRFEHSVGVFHLAQKMVKHLRTEQPELEITNREIELTSLAGLCHDLGHGPFSHAWEGWVRSGLGIADYHHEDMSKKMLEYLVDVNHIDLDQSDIRAIQDPLPSGRRFLYDVVANKRNSVDVDKWDYLQRDSYSLGKGQGFDYMRLLKSSRVIDDEICYNAKNVYTVYDLFQTRYNMHKQVYQHRVSRALDFMIGDAIRHAEPVLNFRKELSDPARFTYLTDNIVYLIERSTDPALETSRAILERVRKRNLYKFVEEILVQPDKVEEIKQRTDTSERMSEASIASHDSRIQASELKLTLDPLNFAMGGNNPVDQVHFFRKGCLDEKITIQRENVSLLIPNQFQEFYLRLFCRNPAKTEAAQTAFRKWLTTVGVKNIDDRFLIGESPRKGPVLNYTTDPRRPAPGPDLEAKKRKLMLN